MNIKFSQLKLDGGETNQYEKNKKVPYVADAVYIEHPIADDNHNPLVSALPLLRTNDDCLKAITCFPLINLSAEANIQERLSAVSTIQQLMIPRNEFYQIDLAITNALHNCYRGRIPFNMDEIIKLKMNYNNAEIVLNTEFRGTSNVRPNNFRIIGAPGAGKSVSVNKCLEYYPQVIVHQSNDMRFIQVTYLHVQCPADCSIKAFYISCLFALEKAIGQSFHIKYDRRTIDQLALLFKLYALRFNLGILVIDEIQNLTIDNSKMMNQLLNLTNETQISFCFIGTYSGMDNIFSKNFKISRRGGKCIYVDRYELGNAFKYVMNNIWKLNYTATPTKLTPELIDAFYIETYGVIGFLIETYKTIQEASILNNLQITPKLVHEVISRQYEEQQQLIQDAIRGIYDTECDMKPLSDFERNEAKKRGQKGKRYA